MAATVHVVERFIAKTGDETALKAILTALIAPTRRELGCIQFDLLENPLDAKDLCFVERWAHDKSLDQHCDASYVKDTLSKVDGMLDTPPDIRRYHQA